MTNSHSQRLIGTLAWDGNLQLRSHLTLPFLFLSEIVTSNIPWGRARSYPFFLNLYYLFVRKDIARARVSPTLMRVHPRAKRAMVHTRAVTGIRSHRRVEYKVEFYFARNASRIWFKPFASRYWSYWYVKCVRSFPQTTRPNRKFETRFMKCCFAYPKSASKRDSIIVESRSGISLVHEDESKRTVKCRFRIYGRGR